MKNVRYIGTYEVYLPTLGLYAAPQDVIEVEDDFENHLFVLVKDGDVAPEVQEATEVPEAQENVKEITTVV
jgi:hypothetical protein